MLLEVLAQFFLSVSKSVLNGLDVFADQFGLLQNLPDHILGHAVAVVGSQEFFHTGVVVVLCGFGQAVHRGLHALLAFLAQRESLRNSFLIQTLQVSCIFHGLLLEVFPPGLAGLLVLHAGDVDSVISVRVGNIRIEIVHRTNGECGVFHRCSRQLIGQAAVQHKNRRKQQYNQHGADGPVPLALFSPCFGLLFCQGALVSALLTFDLTSFLFARCAHSFHPLLHPEGSYLHA